MNSTDFLNAGWKDITDSFEQRDYYLELANKGQAVIRRLHNGWFAKRIFKSKISEKITQKSDL